MALAYLKKSSLKFPAERAGYKIVITRFLINKSHISLGIRL